MGEGYWVTRKYVAGCIGESIKYWVPGQRPKSTRSRKMHQEIRKQEQNAKQSTKQLARLLNANYMEGDILLGLDYGPAGMAKVLKGAAQIVAETGITQEDAIMEAAEHQGTLCLRRVSRQLQKEGIPLRYVFVTSDRDGKTGAPKRVHHHLVINREAADAFREKWRRMGTADFEPLSKQKDYTPIAEYLMAQVRHRPNARKYITSKNLIRPEPKDRIAISAAELRPPRGAELLFRSAFVPGLPQYIRYFLMTPAHVRERRNE